MSSVSELFYTELSKVQIDLIKKCRDSDEISTLSMPLKKHFYMKKTNGNLKLVFFKSSRLSNEARDLIVAAFTEYYTNQDAA